MYGDIELVQEALEKAERENDRLRKLNKRLKAVIREAHNRLNDAGVAHNVQHDLRAAILWDKEES